MRRAALALLSLLFVAAAFCVVAQDFVSAPPREPQAIEETQARLDQLLAPIALYPDALLAQVLVASTYPLEVVALHRWLERNPGLSGDGLERALEPQPWDASVKALAQFRPVVAMMNGELEWTQRLGDAFLAAEADVMDAVQRLRRRAHEAGTLRDSARGRVIVEPGSIVIEGAEPDVVYVPVYDPRVVYGSWWWPAYPPYAWSTAWFGPWDFVVGALYFGPGVRVWRTWRLHPYPDWRDRHLVHRRPGPPVVWRHNPLHRAGVPYLDPRARDRFGGIDRDRVRDRHDFRGFEARPRPATPLVPRPAPPARPAVPPARRSLPAVPQGHDNPLWRPEPRQAERAHSERGRESLHPAPPPGRSRQKP